MKDLGYGKEYKYAHDFPNSFTEEEFLPESLSGTTFYHPGDNPRENALKEVLKNKWKTKYGF
jgi:putative ATPase